MLSERKRGKGYWKLNVSVLKEDGYKKNISDLIKHTIAEYADQVDSSMIWELIKVRVKEFSVKYCCKRSNEQNIVIDLLETKINALDKLIKSDSKDEELILERKQLKDELDSKFADKATGAQIRSKVQFIEEGERSTSYFLGIEKHRQNHNMIKALTKNRITHTEDADILNIAREFYNGLYTSQEPSLSDIDAYLDQIRLPALTEDRQNLCDHAISLVECEVALGNMKPNKSPGDDGLPMEFYKTFWKDIGDLLVEVYNDCFERKELPLSMRKAVITLIPKKGDKTDIENYRPISLTNTDYRILAGVLATRLQKVISDLIGPEQVAYIKGRFIGTNIRLIQDIFQLYNEKNYPGLFMFVDFQKAFDSIEWDFLFKVLEKYGFGNNFKEWIQLLYTKPCAYVKNNGFFSEEFFLTRGVRQGCQVS